MYAHVSCAFVNKTKRERERERGGGRESCKYITIIDIVICLSAK